MLPLHLPRRARLRRDDGDGGDGDRRGARDRRAGAGRAERGGGGGLCRRDAELRPGVPDSEALRPAADDEDRAGGGQGGGRLGRGAAADSRLRRLPREAAHLRLRLRPDDEADLRAGQARRRPARRLRRRRGRARAARGAGGGGREPRAPDADRPPGGDRPARRTLRPAPEGRRGLRRRQRRAGPPLPRLLADLSPDDRAQGHHGAGGQDRDAPAPDADRLDAAAQGRGRRHAVRHLGHHRLAPALHRPGDRQAPRRQPAHGAGRQRLRLHERADAARPAGIPRRHPRQCRPDRRGARRDHRDGRRGDAALRRRAQGRAAVALELRHQRSPERREDAPHAGAAARAGALAAGRRRDARRRGAGRHTAPRVDAQQHAQGRRQPAGAAQHRRRQHRLQPAQDRRRRRHRDRAGAARRRQAGARAHALGHRAADREHDGVDGG